VTGESEQSDPPSALLVDDEPGLLAALRRALHADGIIPLVSLNADQALRVLEEHGPSASVVVRDYGMPGMDGAAFLHEVRLRWPDITRVMLTGNANLEAAARAVNRRRRSGGCLPNRSSQTTSATPSFTRTSSTRCWWRTAACAPWLKTEPNAWQNGTNASRSRSSNRGHGTTI
jgi:CheY-like chemotaxis protein